METQAPQFPEQLQVEAYIVFGSNENERIETLFSQLFSSQEPQRFIAYNLLNCCIFHYPVLLIVKLIFLLRSSPNIETRANSARLLGMVKVQYLWPKLPVPTQVNVKFHLILCLQTEDSSRVLGILCEVIAEIVGEMYKAKDQWEELFDLLGSFMSSQNNKSQKIAMLVFAHIPIDCRRLICEALKPRFEGLYSSVMRALSSQDIDLKIAAFGAVMGLVHLLPISEIILQMIIGVYDFLRDNNEEYAQKGLKQLLMLVKEEHQILKSDDCVHNLVFYVLRVAECETIKDETRRCSIQILMALLIAQDSEPALQILSSECVSRLLNVSMRMLTDIKDDINWYELEKAETDNAGKTDSYFYGIKLLTQLPIASGKMNIVPIVLNGLPVYLDSRDWRRRHAGLTLLGIISRDCSAELILMDEYLNEVVKMVLASFKDEHPRVCWAAFNFLCMPSDTVGAIQILHHTRIAPALIGALNRNQHPRVQEEFVSALLFFVKSISQDCLTTFINLNVVLWKLLSLLKGGNTSTRCKIAGLNIFNFVVKATGQISSNNCAGYVPFLLEVTTDKNLQLKKEVFLAIRLCVEHGGPHFRPFIKGCLPKLLHTLKIMDRSSQDSLNVSDTVVNTIGRIYQSHTENIRASAFVPTWLSFLPLRTNLAEAKAAHEQLCSMIERPAGNIVGPNYEYLHKTVDIFLAVIDRGSELAEEDTIRRMKILLGNIWENCPQNVLNPIIFTLDERKHHILANFVFGTLDLNKTDN